MAGTQHMPSEEHREVVARALETEPRKPREGWPR